MLFQSLDFALFLAAVLAAYWPLRARVRAQDVVIAVASAVFYAFAGWRLLLLLAASSLVAYAVALLVGRSADDRRRTALLAAGIVVNLAMLAYFKYANFFIESVNAGSSMLGAHFRMAPMGGDPARGNQLLHLSNHQLPGRRRSR